ncbi:ER degradation-enhancing alpha-mannosidase-like protein 2 isoform X2 [Contarinia nasturtii]|uniref:ER degradation-enhancing alpha-mannosidase-like protein 2 isoform X2 n=1 Tax=Contarinia nasturtii TaxID=265458 RepID=UPI0012D4A9AD|nr:ER degradation-enhancing alpha-mannosidase-like protein 2 isoform X2 [Contarinia nasturtii]
MMWPDLSCFNLYKCCRIVLFIFAIFNTLKPNYCLRKYARVDVIKLREEVREMFQHAYDGYLNHAADYDELRPLTCDGQNTWGSYSLTLIDSLDTLAVMGNFSEFRRVVDILIQKSNFDSDINVSVFETNIRIVGGLLGAHLMQHRSGAELEPGWPCNGPLLRMAEDVAKRLLPAFDTKTGMPYGTVNLKYGVPINETSVTCTAGVGTFIVEFGALSRLTGDPIYEEVAMNAIYSLTKYISSIGLYGNHIDVQTGRWTGVDSGIGAGVDSFYEYLVKGAIMLNRPELMDIFKEAKTAIDKYLSKNDWHIWASMTKGVVTIPVFQSLDAYWPGVLSMIGDIPNAMKSIYNYHTVWKQYGFLPEFYNIPNSEAGANREGYPLRPELIESVMYLYRATGDSYLLEIGEDMLRSIQHSAKTSCGFATIKNVRDHRKENRMESFFLAETTKYLYLLFDPDNFLNNDGSSGTVVQVLNGECVIDAGGYIFNTEAHPIDPAALRCCHETPYKEIISEDFTSSHYLGEVFQLKIDAESEPSVSNVMELNLKRVVEWLNNDDDKSELLKFIDEAISSKKSNKINPLLSKPTNTNGTRNPNNINASYEELMLFDEILTAEINRNVTKDKNQTKNKIVMRDNQSANWKSEQQETVKISDERESEKIIRPAENETPSKPFDPQHLIERIRKSNSRSSVTSNYELLTCKSQSFLQRLAVLGEILT